MMIAAGLGPLDHTFRRATYYMPFGVMKQWNTPNAKAQSPQGANSLLIW